LPEQYNVGRAEVRARTVSPVPAGHKHYGRHERIRLEAAPDAELLVVLVITETPVIGILVALALHVLSKPICAFSRLDGTQDRGAWGLDRNRARHSGDDIS
jgi:hypothetical protein